MRVFSIGSEYYQRSNGKIAPIYKHAGETAHRLKLERMEWAEIEYLLNRKSKIQILPAEEYVNHFFDDLLQKIIVDDLEPEYQNVVVTK